MDTYYKQFVHNLHISEAINIFAIFQKIIETAAKHSLRTECKGHFGTDKKKIVYIFFVSVKFEPI